VSGDGPNIGGRPLSQARADALAKGFVINALAIRRPGGRPGGPGGMPLEDYYRDNLIGGPASFVEIADEARPFAVAARRKLLTEIAGMPGPWREAQSPEIPALYSLGTGSQPVPQGHENRSAKLP
jgi:hypothetical protein